MVRELPRFYRRLQPDRARPAVQELESEVYHQDQDMLSNTAQAVMQDYANTSCGWYSHLGDIPTSDDIENAILTMVYTAGACR